MDSRILALAGIATLLAAAGVIVLQPAEEESACGDSVCQAVENCSSCPEDCGACGEPGAHEGGPDAQDCSEGEEWCGEKSKCIDPEAEHCLEEPFGAQIGEEANLKWGESRIYPGTNESAVEGWWRASLSVPDKAEYSHLCYIFMRGNKSRRLDSGAYFLDRGPANVSGNEVCEIRVARGPADTCDNLTVRIDIDAMQEGYDPEEDNWRDFFECETGFGSDFCHEECGAMMEVLMRQERSQLNVTTAGE